MIQKTTPESTSFKSDLSSSAKTTKLVKLISCAIFHHIPIKSEVVSLHNDGKCQEMWVEFWQM